MLRADLVNNLAGEGEGSRGGQDHLVAAKDQPGGPGYIVETSGLAIEVVGAVRRANVVVVGTAVEREVACPRRFPGVGVVSGFVSPQYVGSVIDFNRAVQLINRAFLFLLEGANGADVSFFFLRCCRQGAGSRRRSRRLFRRGRDRGRSARLRGSGIRRRQLAGN